MQASPPRRRTIQWHDLSRIAYDSRMNAPAPQTGSRIRTAVIVSLSIGWPILVFVAKVSGPAGSLAFLIVPTVLVYLLIGIQTNTTPLVIGAVIGVVIFDPTFGRDLTTFDADLVAGGIVGMCAGNVWSRTRRRRHRESPTSGTASSSGAVAPTGLEPRR